MKRIQYETLDSTNLEARRLWREEREERDAGAILREPLLLVATEQSSGQGRSGRSWSSPAGGLWMSLTWPLKLGLEAYRALPLVVGLATARALEEQFALPCRIKWPNDILVHGRKLAGILCQSDLQGGAGMIVAGIGINGNYSGEALGTSLRQPPTTLFDLVGRSVDLRALEDAVVRRLVECLEVYEQGGFADRLLPDLRERLAWKGEAVVCSEAEGRVLAQGTLLGVSEDGCALVEKADGEIVSLAIGEMHLSPAPPKQNSSREPGAVGAWPPGRDAEV